MNFYNCWMIFLDRFAEKPGFCPHVVEHKIVVSPEFKPKRLREYRIPEVLKPEIKWQIDELLTAGFIVAVPKGHTSQGVIDLRYLNLYSQSDAFIMPHLQDTVHKVGAAQYITVLDDTGN